MSILEHIAVVPLRSKNDNNGNKLKNVFDDVSILKFSDLSTGRMKELMDRAIYDNLDLLFKLKNGQDYKKNIIKSILKVKSLNADTILNVTDNQRSVIDKFSSEDVINYINKGSKNRIPNFFKKIILPIISKKLGSDVVDFSAVPISLVNEFSKYLKNDGIIKNSISTICNINRYFSNIYKKAQEQKRSDEANENKRKQDERDKTRKDEKERQNLENDAFSALKENWPVKFRIFFAEHKGELSDITIKELAEWFGESKVKSVLSSEFSNMFERYAVNKNTLENILRDKDKLKELPELNQKLLQKFLVFINTLTVRDFSKAIYRCFVEYNAFDIAIAQIIGTKKFYIQHNDKLFRSIFEYMSKDAQFLYLI